MTDPRLTRLNRILDEHDVVVSCISEAKPLLTDIDTADRAAGVVRVDTNDEALRDRLVAVIEASECIEKPEHDNTDGWGLCAICEANAILAALREAS